MQIGMLIAELHLTLTVRAPSLLDGIPAPLDHRLLLPFAGLGLTRIGEVSGEPDGERDGRIDQGVIGDDDVETQTAAAKRVDLHLDALCDDFSARAAAILRRRSGGAPGG